MTDVILYTNEIDWKRTLLNAEPVSQRPRSKKVTMHALSEKKKYLRGKKN